jgi:hypothetical protein
LSVDTVTLRLGPLRVTTRLAGPLPEFDDESVAVTVNEYEPGQKAVM